MYDGTIYIDKFKITQNEFTIPFYNKGKVLRDVKLASQGERSFISIALAFALSSQTMKDYNIMLLPLHNYNEIPAKVVKGWNSNIKKYE